MGGEFSTPLDYATPAAADLQAVTAARRASAALLLATVLWGCGFTWAKAAGGAVHRAVGLPEGSALGPVFILACRFAAAGLLVLLLVPKSRRGWTRRGTGRVGACGVLLAVGLVLQHLGLDRTSEAVSAFLTSLTILFVPILLTAVVRTPPAPVMWLGVVLATAGVWLMTGATPKGFGAGEALGLGCAFVFSVYLLAVNAAAKTEDAWRMTAGQFLVTGALCAATCLLLPGGRDVITPAGAARVLSSGRDVWLNAALLTVFPTFGAFTLLNVYQPRLDATRAALIYLMEPVVAAAYAWLVAGSTLPRSAIAGAALILAANLVVEVLAARARGKGMENGE